MSTLKIAEGYAIPGTVLPSAGTLRIKPIPKTGKAVQYEAVDAKEVMSRMSKRVKGEMPPLQGGIAAQSVPAQAMEQAQQAQNTVAHIMTRTNEDIPAEEWEALETPTGDMDGFDPVPPDQDRSVSKPQRTPTVRAPEALKDPVAKADAPYARYLSKRRRLTLELADSEVTMSVIDVLHSRCGITVLVPQTADSTTFIPRAGSEVTLREGTTVHRCYFPGSHFEIQELNLMGLSFIKVDDEAGGPRTVEAPKA